MDAVLTAMRRHESVADVQKQACLALRNLSRNHAENQLRIGAASGGDAVLTAMRRHENVAKVWFL